MIEITLVLSGLLIGLVLTYAIFTHPLRRRISSLKDQKEELEKAKLVLETTLNAERESFQREAELLSKMQEELDQKFKGLASEALDKNSERLLKLVSERYEKHSEDAKHVLETRKKEIESLVKPIGDTLTKFNEQVNEIEKSRHGAYAGIKQQIQDLAASNANLNTETTKLVNALRQPQARGRWGEMQLRTVLEMAGMESHVDFVEQESFTNLDEARLRPDVVVNLPGHKTIVVDAKTPLDAYLRAIDATDTESRELAMDSHVKQLNKHVKDLSSKDYWRLFAEAPDFVVMFIPGEVFFSSAVQRDPGLIERAFENRVIITTPITLLALLKTVAYGWRQEKLAINAAEIENIGRELYARLKTMGNHFEGLGKSIRQIVNRYNETIGSVENNLLPGARKFKDLGIASEKDEIVSLDPITDEPRSLVKEELKVEVVKQDGIIPLDQEKHRQK